MTAELGTGDDIQDKMVVQKTTALQNDQLNRPKPSLYDHMSPLPDQARWSKELNVIWVGMF